MVGILEPRYRVGEVKGKVLRRDSAAKSLIGEGDSSIVAQGKEGEGVEVKA